MAHGAVENFSGSRANEGSVSPGPVVAVTEPFLVTLATYYQVLDIAAFDTGNIGVKECGCFLS